MQLRPARSAKLLARCRKQTLVEQFGAEIPLPDLREVIAPCDRARKIHDACRVHYVTLKAPD